MSDDTFEPVPKHMALQPYWEGKLPAPIAKTMRGVPASLDVSERAAEHVVHLELPALSDDLKPEEKLEELQLLKSALDTFSERVHYGEAASDTTHSLHHLKQWRTERRNDNSHVTDYDYLLLQSLARFQRTLNAACEKMEDGTPCRDPLPHCIEIALGHGYHASSESLEIVSELQALHGTLWGLEDAIQTVIKHTIRPSAFMAECQEAVSRTKAEVALFSELEQQFESSLEAQLPAGETPQIGTALTEALARIASKSHGSSR